MGLQQIMHGLRPRLPRPKTFLGCVSLQSGTELVAGVLFFNKLTGAYGLLAILTGFSLNASQLTAYLYNFAVLVLVAVCFPHIRRETPLPNLALAWAYAIDTLVNAAYTVYFAVTWYFAVTAGTAARPAAAAAPSPAAAAASASPDAPALARRDEAATAESVEYGGGFMNHHEMAASLTLIGIVTAVRFYFLLVVVAHTRQALQRYGDHVVEAAAAADGALNDDDDDKDDNGGEGSQHSHGSQGGGVDQDIDDEEAGLKSGTRSAHRGHAHRRQRIRPRYPPHPGLGRPGASLAGSTSSRNPFADGSPAGEGWKGRLGRALVGFGGQNFWLGRQKDDAWTRDVNAHFRS